MSLDRRLSAILSADVHGYSRLMAADELATVRTLTAHRDAMAATIVRHGGRVVDAPGDNLLAEFPSAVLAVECAIAVQAALAASNRATAARMQWRIGINVGDVLVEGDRMYGDGVNIAARVQELAAAGGICVSGTAYDQVKGKVAAGFESRGAQRLKNLADPVRVYAVAPASAEPASVEAAVGAGPLPLPDRPSVAVLPFAVIGGDPAAEAIADGMTEEIITTLSRIPGMFVIASASMFRFKSAPVKVGDVAREVGVRHVLQGTVRRSEHRLRISAQLTDAPTGFSVWAERYDRAVGDIFELQDDITRHVVTALEVTLGEGEQVRVWSRGTTSFEAWESFVRGLRLHRTMERQPNAEARGFLGRAIELDPGFAMAHVMLGWAYWLDVWWEWTKDLDAGTARADDHARRGLALDPHQAFGHSLLGAIHLQAGRFDDAITASEQAVALSPSESNILVIHAYILSRAGREEEAIRLARDAIRLAPTPPLHYLATLSQACRRAGRHDEALAAAELFVRRAPENWFGHYLTALAQGAMGREADGRAALARATERDPSLDLRRARALLVHRSPEQMERGLDLLRRLGLT